MSTLPLRPKTPARAYADDRSREEIATDARHCLLPNFDPPRPFYYQGQNSDRPLRAIEDSRAPFVEQFGAFAEAFAANFSTAYRARLAGPDEYVQAVCGGSRRVPSHVRSSRWALAVTCVTAIPYEGAVGRFLAPIGRKQYDKLRGVAFTAAEAREHFERAEQSAPHDPLIVGGWLSLADALYPSGYDHESAKAARRLLIEAFTDHGMAMCM